MIILSLFYCFRTALSSSAGASPAILRPLLFTFYFAALLSLTFCRAFCAIDNYSITLSGREVKTVNAWFQNKRASSKKRSNRGGSSNNNSNNTSNAVSASGSSRSTHNNAPSASAQVELPPISALIASVSAPSPHMDDYDSEDEHLPPFLDRAQHARQQSAFYAGNPQHQHMFEHESHAAAVAAARKGRSRPSAAQTEELRKLYDMNAHPSKEEREELGVRIGMCVSL